MRLMHVDRKMKMIPEDRFTDEDIQKRFETFYGDSRSFTEGQIPYFREKLSSLSEFVREIKVGFARYYNRRHDRRGYFWEDREPYILGALYSAIQSILHLKPNSLLTLLYFACIISCKLRSFAYEI